MPPDIPCRTDEHKIHSFINALKSQSRRDAKVLCWFSLTTGRRFRCSSNDDTLTDQVNT